jgi:alpha-2-macroglobulin-like protein
VLALDYLRRTGTAAPEVEARAKQYIHLGYQRLVGFEVPGGGFDWFGRPPANTTLTAYGLMEFTDMARVHDVDPSLLQRTRRWLLSQRQADGTWPAGVMIDDGLAGSVRQGDPNLATTAYIAWAVFGEGAAGEEAGPTLDYLLSHRPETIDNPYLLAIIANVLVEAKRDREAEAYLARLESLARTDEAEQLVWWEQPDGSQTMFYGAGRSGEVETTALAALALLKAGRNPAMTQKSLSWLISQKDPQGTWHSTQATVLALKALLEGTGAPLGGDRPREIEITLNGNPVEEIVIPADQGEVMKLVDLSRLLEPGEQRVGIRETSQTAAGYQVTFAYHVEGGAPESTEDERRLAIDVSYDRTRLAVEETIAAVATVRNGMDRAAPMILVDLSIPGGFALERGELDELVGEGKIARYQLTPRQAIVYLRSLAPGETLELPYRLRATMRVQVQAPAAQVYEYYNPENRAESESVELHATDA